MPEANASDVRVEIDTELDNTEIGTLLNRIEREWKREYSTSDFDGTDHIQDFEAALAALRIAEGRDRRAESVGSGRSRVEYETAEIENLRQRVRRAEPGDVFGRAGSVTRDAARYTTATDQ